MDVGLIAARFVHFGSTMVLSGATFFAAVLAPSSIILDLAPWLRRLTITLGLVSLASAMAWFFFVARAMAGDDLDFGALRDVATGTSFGWVWQGRIALLALFLAAVIWPDRHWRGPAVLAILATASLCFVGHAAAQTGALGVAHRANHACHLIATSGWLGGLPLFLACLNRFSRDHSRRDALTAMMRFSKVGHFAVAVVFVSGAVDIALTTHALPWPPVTSYRQLLCVKVAVVVAMTVLALFNRYVLAPKAGREPIAARALAAGAATEVALAFIAVALVSAFATLDPA